MRQAGSAPVWALAGAAVTLSFSPGCRPARETSKDAAPLPLATADPLEDGVDVDCWPGFRGRGAQGVAPGGKPAVHFSGAEGFRWKIEVPGQGWSSPVVWKDRVLLTSALDETDPPTLAVLCYDRADGRLRWKAEAGQAAGGSHSKNGYASASVATDGERVVAFFGTTGLFCYDHGRKAALARRPGQPGTQVGNRLQPGPLRQPGDPVVRQRAGLLPGRLRQDGRPRSVAHAPREARLLEHAGRGRGRRRRRPGRDRGQRLLQRRPGRPPGHRLRRGRRAALVERRRHDRVGYAHADGPRRAGLLHQRAQRAHPGRPARRRRRRDPAAASSGAFAPAGPTCPAAWCTATASTW